MKCLAHRVRTVCSKDTLDKELDHLQGVFQTPASERKKLANNNDADDTEKQHLLVTPYVKGLSENIERRCKHINI